MPLQEEEEEADMPLESKQDEEEICMPEKKKRRAELSFIPPIKEKKKELGGERKREERKKDKKEEEGKMAVVAECPDPFPIFGEKRIGREEAGAACGGGIGEEDPRWQPNIQFPKSFQLDFTRSASDLSVWCVL